MYKDAILSNSIILALLDTRESAFVHALFSASLAHSVAKACMDGKIYGCSCAKKPAYLPEGKRLDEVRFSSCTNFLSVGIRFAGRFADAGFRRKKRHIRLISSVLKHHNSKIGREVKSYVSLHGMICIFFAACFFLIHVLLFTHLVSCDFFFLQSISFFIKQSESQSFIGFVLIDNLHSISNHF